MGKTETIIDKFFKNNRLRIIRMGMSFSGSSLLTIWMKNNMLLITLLLRDLEPMSTLFLWGGLVITVEGIIFMKSHLYFGEENKTNDINSKQSQDYPNGIFVKLFMFMVITGVYLFFFPILKIFIFKEGWILIVLLLNFISIYLILGEVMKLIHVAIKTFLNSIPDSKDRLVVAVTFMGSIVSLIALLK